MSYTTEVTLTRGPGTMLVGFYLLCINLSVHANVLFIRIYTERQLAKFMVDCIVHGASTPSL